jgi:hypothetical protein
MSDLEEDVLVESDCEGDLPGVEDQLREVENEPPDAVLIRGSLSACVDFHQIRYLFRQK